MYKRPGREFEDRQMWEIRAGESKHKQVRSVKGTLAGGGKKAPEPPLSSGAWFPVLGRGYVCVLRPGTKSQGHSGQVGTRFSSEWSLVGRSMDRD